MDANMPAGADIESMPSRLPQPGRRLVIAAAFIAAACSSSPPKSDPVAAPAPFVTAVDAYSLASAATRAGDHALALRHLRRADSLAPDYPVIVLQLARTHARMRDTSAALRQLERLATLGYGGRLVDDTALAPLRSLPAFQRIAGAAAINAEPLIRSDTSFVIAEPGLAFEGMTHAGSRERPTFYLGAMRAGTARIIQVDGASRAIRDLVPDVPGTFLGLHLDRAGRLWTAHVDRSFPDPPGRPTPTGAALHVYDATTGTLQRRYPSPADGRMHLFNDVVAVPDGRVFITDSDANAVYVLDSGADSLAVFVPPAVDFTGPNGITLSADGSRLYVATLEGIVSVALRDGRRTRLARPAELAVVGIDGLYACGRNLIAVQGWTSYDRMMLFRLNAAGDSIVGGEILERQHPAYQAPSTGTIVGRDFHYIAARSRARTAADSSSALVLRLPLGGRCG
jgi:hypothetical protein